MTNLEALRARVGYPLSDDAITIALERRGKQTTDTFDATADARAFDLAYADCLITILTSPASLSEGGYSISTGDKKVIQDTANFIYNRYSEPSPIMQSKPTAKFIQKW